MAFIYPGRGMAAVNEPVVPVGVPVHFRLTSTSVMNAFFIPQMGSMIYTMNGMATQLYLQVDAPGVYRGISSHYSGDGFSDMHFEVHALEQAAFDAWTQTARGGGLPLDAATYATLSRQSTADAPLHFGAVEPQVFDRIVMQHLAAWRRPRSRAQGRGAGPQ